VKNDSIITTFIRQDLANKSLFMNALAQIIIKVLYQADMDCDSIYENIYNIVRHKIDKKHINGVLDDLLCSNKITSKSGIFSLSETYRIQVMDCENSRNIRYKKAIEKYFKNSTLEESVLEDLFDDINIAFFKEYNNEWIEDFIGRSRSKRTYIENFKALVEKSIFSRYKIENNTAVWFFSQYLSFLRSNDPENGLLMLDYANSLFAAKLLSANIFADTSAKEMFQKTKVIFDTNILLCLNLEKDKYSESYRALEEIFILLEIEPIYFHITKEEYSRAIESKIYLIKKAVEIFDKEVLSHSDDVFLQTLLFRNCNSEEDFDRFYNSLREIPDFLFQELSIKEYDNREVSEHIEKEIAKKKLQKEMNEIYMRYHGFSKRENSLNHDAGIISGQDYIKNTSPTWILTRDGTVHTYSIEHARIGELPLAINLSSLIHLLCINNGGIDGNSMDFGPLFSQFIKNDVIPLTDTFQLEDLTRMSEIESLVSQLPNDSIISLARELNHDKLKGEPDRKIALKIQRSIQSHKIEIKDELESTRNSLLNTEEREKELLVHQENMKTNFKLARREELCDRIIPKFRFLYWGRYFLQVGIILFASFLLYRFIEYRVDVIISVIIAIVANILIGSISYKMFWFPNYFKKKKEKEAEIDDIVNKEWDKLNNR
jgi:hypothetical protein